MKLLRISLLTIAALTVGCVEKDTIRESSTASTLTKAELQDILIGNTFPFSKGGIYFATDTQATVQWDGKIEDTQWYATDESTFCYTAKLFGDEEECLGLKKTPSGDYLREFEGKAIPIKASDIRDGKSF
jgi:hypothetical protein